MICFTTAKSLIFAWIINFILTFFDYFLIPFLIMFKIHPFSLTNRLCLIWRNKIRWGQIIYQILFSVSISLHQVIAESRVCVCVIIRVDVVYVLHFRWIADIIVGHRKIFSGFESDRSCSMLIVQSFDGRIVILILNEV